MKKILVVLMATLLIIATLAGCGEKFYYAYDINDYISVGTYSNVVDRNTLEYFDALDEFYNMTFGTNLGYEAEEGKVENGDLANIDYVGKLNGVAFEGGTAKNYDLEIGSGTFIPGFEDGLIGVDIGSTVDLDITFPKEYHSAELAGKAVVFTVTVNYVTKYADPTEPDARKYGFEDLADYKKQADEHAVRSCIFQHVYAATTFNSFPTKEEEELQNGMIEFYEQNCAAQGITLDQFAASYGYTLDQFKEVIREQFVRPYMKRDLVAYYVLQVNKQKLTGEDVDAKIKELDEKNEKPLEELGYDQLEFEQEAALDKAMDILYAQAEIKN